MLYEALTPKELAPDFAMPATLLDSQDSRSQMLASQLRSSGCLGNAIPHRVSKTAIDENNAPTLPVSLEALQQTNETKRVLVVKPLKATCLPHNRVSMKDAESLGKFACNGGSLHR